MLRGGGGRAARRAGRLRRRAARSRRVGHAQAGARVGTLLYMAPEQIRDPRRVDGRADVFRARLRAVRMLDGCARVPRRRRGSPPSRKFCSIMPPDPRKLRPELPGEGGRRHPSAHGARYRDLRPNGGRKPARAAGRALRNRRAGLSLAAPQRTPRPHVRTPPSPALVAPADRRVRKRLGESFEARGRCGCWHRSAQRATVGVARSRLRATASSGATRSSRTWWRSSSRAQSCCWFGGRPGIGKTRPRSGAFRDAVGPGRLGSVQLVDLGQARDMDDALRVIIGCIAASLRGAEERRSKWFGARARPGSAPACSRSIASSTWARELGPLLEACVATRGARRVLRAHFSRKNWRIEGAIMVELGPARAGKLRRPARRRARVAVALPRRCFAERGA